MVKTALKDRKAFVELLIKRGFLTLHDFADYAQIGYSTVQQVTSGIRNPTPKTAIKIASALGLKFDDLFVFVHREGKVLDAKTQEEMERANAAINENAPAEE